MLPVKRASAQRLRLGTDEITVLATCAQTDGALFAVEITMPPGGGLLTLHRHAPGEVYHVLQGEFAFYIGDRDAPDGPVRRVVAAAGDVVPLAGNTPHTIRNEAATDAVAFVVHAPGGPMEGFVCAAAALARQGHPSIEAVLDLAEQHGIEMLGPIPGPGVREAQSRR